MWSAAVVAVIVLAGCSGSSDTLGTLKSAPTTAAQPSTSGSPGASGDRGTSEVIRTIDGAAAGQVQKLVDEIDVNETVRYAGFDIQVTNVLIGFDPANFFVAQVNVDLTNQTPRDYTFSSVVEIESQGFVAGIDRESTSKVLAGDTQSGSFSLRLDQSFTVEDAVLYIGKPENNRVQIPLGSEGELIAHTPVDLAVDEIEPATDEVSTVTVTKLTLSWDSPEPRAQSEAEKAFLKVEYELDSTVATALSEDVIELRLPSGAHITPVDASIGSVDADETASDLFARFVINDPPAGDYVLVYTERFGKSVVEVPIIIPDDATE